jgi:putative copper export protein
MRLTLTFKRAAILKSSNRTWPLVESSMSEAQEAHWSAVNPRLRGAWSRLAMASWITVIVSGVAWFGAVTASIAGEASLLNVSPETFVTVLLQTQFGHLWLTRSGRCLVLGVLLLIDCRESIIAFFSLAILASLAVAGHAAAIASGASMLALVGDIGHLVGAALWPGGLVPLLMVLSWQRRDVGRKNLRLVAGIHRCEAR